MRSARITAVIWLFAAACFFILEDSLLAAVLLLCTAAVFLCCLLMAAASGRRCIVEIRASENINKGDVPSARVRIKNLSLLPVFRYAFSLSCENVLTGEQCAVPLSLSAGPKGETELTVSLEEGFCGYIRYRAREAGAWDPFCLFRFKRETDAEAGTYVMPQIREMPIDTEQLSAYNMESYLYSSAKKGNDPSETFGIREYAPGDSPKTIHWKLTGKAGDVMVRELGLPVENSVLLLLDKRMEKGESLEAEFKENAVELFLSLSHGLISQDMAHSVAWQDYRTGRFILRRITNTAELWAVCGILLAGPFGEDPVSTPVHYLENCGEQRFASCLYVTAGGSPDAERLEGYCATTIYRAQKDE